MTARAGPPVQKRKKQTRMFRTTADQSLGVKDGNKMEQSTNPQPAREHLPKPAQNKRHIPLKGPQTTQALHGGMTATGCEPRLALIFMISDHG